MTSKLRDDLLKTGAAALATAFLVAKAIVTTVVVCLVAALAGLAVGAIFSMPVPMWQVGVGVAFVANIFKETK